MLVNQLYCVPTPDTLAFMAAIMGAGALDVYPESWVVNIMTTLDPLEPNQNNVYSATASSVRVYYDSALQRSSLIMSLESPDLQQRCLELNSQGVVREFYDHYSPFMRIRPDMPSLSRHYKRYVVQVANAMCQPDRVLEFSNEFVTTENLATMPDMDYMQAMYAEQMGIR